MIVEHNYCGCRLCLSGFSTGNPFENSSLIPRSYPKSSVFWDVTDVAFVRAYVHPKRRFLQEPRGVTYQKTAFFIVTAVKTSNLT
jgi:hypothetical protein